MHATVAPKLQNGRMRAFWKANSFIYRDLETSFPNFILIRFYLFSKSRVFFGRGSRPSHTKNHATVAKNLGMERIIALWKANAIIYKHTKA
jgi:hypothetical protein